MKKLLYLFVLSIFVFSSCKKDDPMPVTVDDPINNVNDTIGQGTFISYQHSLGGKALLYNETGGGRTLRLENFTMTEGPDVFVYLSKTNNYSAANVIQIANLTTGYTNSNINFSATNANYTSDYKYVLVYCVQYSALFGYAELQ